MANWVIEKLKPEHDRAGFSCGKPALDTFLTSLVSQYEKRGLSRTYIAIEPGQLRVAGYYTLAAGSFEWSSLPAGQRKKFPKHSLPTVHLARLAVDLDFQGKRLGETLVVHALQSALELSKKLGAFAVDLWAIDDQAVAFYAKYGFVPLEDNQRHLFLAMKLIAGMFAP
jgi:GNAT superfamily N-acetyltransferase